MKNFFLFSILLATQFPFANNNDYKNRIAKDRIILFFEKNISAERKAEIIHASGLVSDFTNLPTPALTICIVNDFEAAQKYFSNQAEIQSVSFFITDGQKHYAGVLNEFFVKLKDKNFEPLLKEKLQQENLGEAKADKYIPNLYMVINYQSSIINTIELAAKFQRKGWCEYATPNYLFNPIVATNDPLYNRQWNIKNDGTPIQGNGTADADMDVDSAWLWTTGDPSVKVSIIDSGVDTLHGDLVQNILPGHDAVSDSTDGYPTPAYAEDGHGTCCAGIVAATKDNNLGVSGVAPSCKIIPVRSFYYINFQGNVVPFSTAAFFADAIGWSWSVANADVMSNSWGLPDILIQLLEGGTQPVNDAIQTAITNGRGGKGTPLFFSSGNEDDGNGPIWPAKLSTTIAVNATTMCDERKNPTDCSGETWASNYGVGSDFSAPGVKISTTDIRGNKGFSGNDYTFTFNGTSAACPNAAAVGALVLSLNPLWKWDDVRNIIAQSCEKVGGYNYDSLFYNGTWCNELGYGRINANKALEWSLSYNSIKEETENITLKIFPNPANNSITVFSSVENVQLKIFSLAGDLVFESAIKKGVNREDISLLPAGMFIANIVAGEKTTAQKLAVVK